MTTKAACSKCKIVYIIHDCDRVLCTLNCRCGASLVYYRSRRHWRHKHVSVNQSELIPARKRRVAIKLNERW